MWRPSPRAKNVRVTLGCAKNSATLTIEDDGKGFDTRRIARGRHGIVGMRERARAAGGSLRIASGKGTRVVARVHTLVADVLDLVGAVTGH